MVSEITGKLAPLQHHEKNPDSMGDFPKMFPLEIFPTLSSHAQNNWRLISDNTDWRRISGSFLGRFSRRFLGRLWEQFLEMKKSLLNPHPAAVRASRSSPLCRVHFEAAPIIFFRVKGRPNFASFSQEFSGRRE